MISNRTEQGIKTLDIEKHVNIGAFSYAVGVMASWTLERFSFGIRRCNHSFFQTRSLVRGFHRLSLQSCSGRWDLLLSPSGIWWYPKRTDWGKHTGPIRKGRRERKWAQAQVLKVVFGFPPLNAEDTAGENRPLTLKSIRPNVILALAFEWYKIVFSLKKKKSVSKKKKIRAHFSWFFPNFQGKVNSNPLATRDVADLFTAPDGPNFSSVTCDVRSFTPKKKYQNTGEGQRKECGGDDAHVRLNDQSLSMFSWLVRMCRIRSKLWFLTEGVS